MTSGRQESLDSINHTLARVMAPDELPKVNVSKLPFADVRQHLPATTRVVSADERKEQIRIRQEHVQRRYRQY